MTNPLHIHLAQQATARAHLAGAEAAELDAQADELAGDPPASFDEATGNQRIAFGLAYRAQAARRRYWRELAGAALLTGHRWEAAERLGAES